MKNSWQLMINYSQSSGATRSPFQAFPTQLGFYFLSVFRKNNQGVAKCHPLHRLYIVRIFIPDA